MRARRLERRWTQEQLAEACGVQARTISRIERATLLPSLTSLYDISRALGCTIPDLIDEQASPLSADEQKVLDAWRSAGGSARSALLALLLELGSWGS